MYANDSVALVPGESLSCNISFQSHREICGWLPKKQNCEVKKKKEKGREYLKGVCKAMMKSQMCDNSSVGDIFFFKS